MTTDDLMMGGSQRVLVDFSNALAERGWPVIVAASPGPLTQDLVDDVVYIPLPPRTNALSRVKFALRTAALVRRTRPLLVHAHQRQVAAVSRLATWGRKTLVVEHVHNTFVVDWRKRISFLGHHQLACSQAIADMLVSEFGKDRGRVTVIRNATRDEWADDPRVLPYVDGADRPTITVIARASEQKDPLRFVRVMEELQSRGVVVDAYWVGGGGLLDQCREEVARLGLGTVHFVGESRDVRRYLARTDVVLLTSRWEGLPLTLIEAASAGRPLIAPDIGACSEIVRGSANGVLYPPGATPAEIADAIISIISSEDLREMGAESRRIYEQEFTLDRVIASLIATYEKLVELPPRDTNEK